MTLYGDFVTGQTVPFQRMRQLLLDQGGGIQEGVVGANDLKVAQRGAGANMSVDVAAGMAWVQIDTGTRNGLAHVVADATANVTVTASNGTNPRIDQIIVRYNDTSIPTGSGNTPTLEVLTGTATAGATLDNRTGALALPSDCMRLADILVPAASSSVTTANIRDRRPWARGAFYATVRTAGDYTNSGPMTDIDGTNLVPAIEVGSYGTVRLTLRTSAYVTSGAATSSFQTRLRLTTRAGTSTFSDAGEAVTGRTANIGASFVRSWTFWNVTPGSYIAAPQFAGNGIAVCGLSANPTNPLVFEVEEILRPNMSN